jgi:hypothetical protein
VTEVQGDFSVLCLALANLSRSTNGFAYQANLDRTCRTTLHASPGVANSLSDAKITVFSITSIEPAVINGLTSGYVLYNAILDRPFAMVLHADSNMKNLQCNWRV